LPGLAYEAGGWPLSLSLIIVMIAIQALVVATAWKN
jgi:hypothetical protein